jgi:hypothetical protein
MILIFIKYMKRGITMGEIKKALYDPYIKLYRIFYGNSPSSHGSLEAWETLGDLKRHLAKQGFTVDKDRNILPIVQPMFDNRVEIVA